MPPIILKARILSSHLSQNGREKLLSIVDHVERDGLLEMIEQANNDKRPGRFFLDQVGHQAGEA
ncbi:MAG: hypothetical protein M3539_16090 [Acidobacteriota bacterium]|nr:hypothetical protein [Acidobacteriota bacterium]